MLALVFGAIGAYASWPQRRGAYRDARVQAMTDPDWSEIECRLRRAYRSLKATVAGD